MKYYGFYLMVCSFIAFCLYGIDKWKAQSGGWRISEKTLLGISLIGGGVGGYLAMQLFRHKTKHWYFHVINVFAIAWQMVVLGLLL